MIKWSRRCLVNTWMGRGGIANSPLRLFFATHKPLKAKKGSILPCKNKTPCIPLYGRFSKYHKEST